MRVAAREPGGWTTWRAARGPRVPYARRRADLWPGCAPPESVVRGARSSGKDSRRWW